MAAKLPEEVPETPQEPNAVTSKQAKDSPWQGQGTRITVALIPAVQSHLQRLQERTNLSMTDLANRAITSYEFFDAQMQAGHDVIVRNNKTGETRLVRFQ
jgi:hypothetical protein